jgi:hypothetical protein
MMESPVEDYRQDASDPDPKAQEAVNEIEQRKVGEDSDNHASDQSREDE